MKPITSFNSKNRRHIANLHKILITVGDKLKPDYADVKKVEIGNKTKVAIKAFQKDKGLNQNGTPDDETIKRLNTAVRVIQFSKRMGLVSTFDEADKTQITKIHKILIALDSGIKADNDEVKECKISNETKKAIKAFQKKAGLPQNGNIDQKTLEKLNAAIIKKKFVSKIKPIANFIPENKAHVTNLHKMLIFLGDNITVDIEEINSRKIGEFTKNIIKEFYSNKR